MVSRLPIRSLDLLPMQACFVYNVSGSTAPLITTPAILDAPACDQAPRTICCGEKGKVWRDKHVREMEEALERSPIIGEARES